MKKHFILLILLIGGINLSGQQEFLFKISPNLGTLPFELNKPFTHPGGVYPFQLARFEYYISEISIVHDGGQITPATDVYILARPAVDSVYSLGSFSNIQNVEAIRFSVGVDPAHNHLDPAIYIDGHPLALQDPSMHWGWTAGYRFAAIEGVAGTNLNQVFEIHALGDDNYKSVEIPVQSEFVDAQKRMIHLQADYSRVFTSIILSRGLIVHGTGGAVITLMNNFERYVFRAANSTGTNNPEQNFEFQIWPNPLTGQLLYIESDQPMGSDSKLEISNLQGQLIFQKNMSLPGEWIALPEDLTGVFMLRMIKDRQVSVSQKLVKM